MDRQIPPKPSPTSQLSMDSQISPKPTPTPQLSMDSQIPPKPIPAPPRSGRLLDASFVPVQTRAGPGILVVLSPTPA